MANSTIVKAAIEAMGGYSATARKISAKGKAVLTYQAVQSWVKQGNIPARHVLDISRETGISPEVLSPEVFGN